MRLVVGHDLIDEVVVVRVEGDIDSSNVAELADHLVTATAVAAGQPSALLVIDLQGVTFFASAGLNALFECHEKGTANGITVRLVATQPEVVRPIEVTKLDSIVAIYPSVTEAVTPRVRR